MAVAKLGNATRVQAYDEDSELHQDRKYPACVFSPIIMPVLSLAMARVRSHARPLFFGQVPPAAAQLRYSYLATKCDSEPMRVCAKHSVAFSQT